jgi:hypothetical protein
VLLPAIITSGATETRGEGYCRIPKRDLVIQLQVLLQCEALRIAAGLKDGATLVAEMQELCRIFGEMENTLGPVAFLLLFVVSPCVTGLLVLGRPVFLE